MAAPLFANPVLKAKVTGKAIKLPGKLEVDPELGQASSRASSPDTSLQVNQTAPRRDIRNALFPDYEIYGLTGKGKRKTRKHKKHSKKTQKRRARK